MIQTLPHSTLLQYVYNELPVERQREVEEALQHDPDLAATCADLLLAQRALDLSLIHISEPTRRS